MARTQEAAGIVCQIRECWPGEIEGRPSSGFCCEDRMRLVQVAERKLRVGFARIEQLRKRSAPQSEEAARWPQTSGRPSRLFFSDRENANSASMKTRGVPASTEPVEASDSPCGAATGPGADPWPAQAL